MTLFYLMNHLQIDMSKISRDNEGYLCDPQDWTIDIANSIADEEEQVLTDAHWLIINYVRDYFEDTGTVPEARKLLKHMQQALGPDKGTRRYLYELFPTGYGQTACKIAGMRKPLKLMLDV